MGYKEAHAIVEALNFIYELCDKIQDYDRCDECPLRYMCLDDSETAIVEIYDLISEGSWNDFISYGDNISFRDEDLEAQYADRQRKEDIEGRMIDEQDGY